MAKANEKRVHVTLECTSCKRRNYITSKNKVNDRERIEMRKYCRWERQHTVHKETRGPISCVSLRTPLLLVAESPRNGTGQR
jgi:large subunit ribosomal protein L33